MEIYETCTKSHETQIVQLLGKYISGGVISQKQKPLEAASEKHSYLRFLLGGGWGFWWILGDDHTVFCGLHVNLSN
jgi:hypothetical protein